MRAWSGPTGFATRRCSARGNACLPNTTPPTGSGSRPRPCTSSCTVPATTTAFTSGTRCTSIRWLTRADWRVDPRGFEGAHARAPWTTLGPARGRCRDRDAHGSACLRRLSRRAGPAHRPRRAADRDVCDGDRASGRTTRRVPAHASSGLRHAFRLRLLSAAQRYEAAVGWSYFGSRSFAACGAAVAEARLGACVSLAEGRARRACLVGSDELRAP